MYYRGAAQPDTGTPGNVGGQDAQRVVRAPVDGIFYAQRKIGDRLKAGEVIGRVITVDVSLTDSAAGRLAAIDRDASQPLGIVVKTKIDGVLRGVLHDGLKIAANTKIADVDPRGEAEYCFTVSDKSWAVGGGALEAVLYLMQRICRGDPRGCPAGARPSTYRRRYRAMRIASLTRISLSRTGSFSNSSMRMAVTSSTIASFHSSAR